MTDQRPKPKSVKRPSAEDDEAHRALSEIRNMFRSRGYDPSKYHDDDDDSDMDAGFDDILREEKRSARIAQQKDEEEARLLEEEEEEEEEEEGWQRSVKWVISGRKSGILSNFVSVLKDMNEVL